MSPVVNKRLVISPEYFDFEIEHWSSIEKDYFLEILKNWNYLYSQKLHIESTSQQIKEMPDFEERYSVPYSNDIYSPLDFIGYSDTLNPYYRKIRETETTISISVQEDSRDDSQPDDPGPARESKKPFKKKRLSKKEKRLESIIIRALQKQGNGLNHSHHRGLQLSLSS